MNAAFLLIVAAAIYRAVLNSAGAEGAGWVSNFSPIAAIAFCGAIYLPKRLAFAVPLFALLISDFVIHAGRGISMITDLMLARYAAFAVVVFIGLLVRTKTSIATIGAGAVCGTLFFHFVTNTVSWLAEPGYAKTLAGWMQALTVGLPEYASFAPTWIFLRNSLVSDLLYTALFVGCAAGSHSDIFRRDSLQPCNRARLGSQNLLLYQTTD